MSTHGNRCLQNIMGLGSSESRLQEGAGSKLKGDSFIYPRLGHDRKSQGSQRFHS